MNEKKTEIETPIEELFSDDELFHADPVGKDNLEKPRLDAAMSEDEAAVSNRRSIEESITDRNIKERVRADEEFKANAEKAREEAEEREFFAEADREEREFAFEYSKMEPDAILEQFSEAEIQDGGFPDLWKNEKFRELAIDRAQELIDSGYPADNYATYIKAGRELRQRMKDEKDDSALVIHNKRADMEQKIAGRRRREIQQDNSYFKSIDPHSKPQPRNHAEIRGRLASEYPDLMEPNSYGRTAEKVDELQNEQFRRDGRADDSYRTYADAAERIRTQNALMTEKMMRKAAKEGWA